MSRKAALAVKPTLPLRPAARSSAPSGEGERRSRRRQIPASSRPVTIESTAPTASLSGVFETRAPWRNLEASPLNYRETYDPIKLQELKDEIRLQGLAHNLVARPLPEGRFEIVIGGRRLRALGELVEEGAWDPDAPNVPLQVRSAMTDLEVLILAMGENNKRQDVHYLEEAEGIRRAIDLMTKGKGPSRKDKTTARLAEQLGVGQRWVQILNGLARRLDPGVKDFIRERDLTLDCAKAFAMVPAERQAKILPELREARYLDPDTIREWATDSLPSVEAALFDQAAYKGPITQVGLFADDVAKSRTGVVLPAGAEEALAPEAVTEHFVDIEEFARLQRAAVSRMCDELAKKYAFAEVVEGTYLPKTFENHFGTRDTETGIVLLLAPDLSVRKIECKRHRPAPAKLPPAPALTSTPVGKTAPTAPTAIVLTIPAPAVPAVPTVSVVPATVPALSDPIPSAPMSPSVPQEEPVPPLDASSAGDPQSQGPEPIQFPNVGSETGSSESSAGSEPDDPDDAPDASPLVKSHVYRAHRAKTQALQAALARSPADAMRVAIVGLLGLTTFVRIKTQDVPAHEDWTLSPELLPQLEALRLALGELLPDPFMPVRDEASRFSPNNVRIDYHALWDEQTPARVLGILAALSDSAVAELFAFLVAVNTGSFCDLSPKYGDEPGAFRLAEILGLENAMAPMDDEFLGGYRKFHLLAVARHCGVNDPKLNRKTMAEIRQAILAAPGFASFQPPELLFGDTRDVERSLRSLSRQEPPAPVAEQGLAAAS
jgi:hypothetical protein